jgi:toxin ParE1/3/4
MNLPIVFRRAARAEFDEAANWYERRRSGLGEAFTTAVHRVMDRISTQPEFYAIVDHDVREAMVSGYPYCVYYRAELARIVVLAVFHASRDPSLWQVRE